MNTPIDQKKIIGENIKAARKIKGLSQRALAEKLGIAFQNLSVWENGKGAPSAKYLTKLAEILEISLDQLTSPAGFITSPERRKNREAFTRFGTGFTADQLLPELRKSLQSELPKLIQWELSENHSLKLIIAYLEEILSILRGSSQERLEIRRAADSGESYRSYSQAPAKIPLPPVDLSTEDRLKWERNAATLLKWSQSDKVFWVPQWAMEKYCREVEPAPFGNNLDEVAKILKDFVEKGKSD